jgi:ribosomal protein L13E
MRVRHWIDAATKKTYRETRGKMEAKAASQPIPAKKAPAAPLTSAQAQTRPVHPDSTANDDLPF